MSAVGMGNSILRAAVASYERPIQQSAKPVDPSIPITKVMLETTARRALRCCGNESARTPARIGARGHDRDHVRDLRHLLLQASQRPSPEW